TQEAREAKSSSIVAIQTSANVANEPRDREGKTSETNPAPVSEVLLSRHQTFDPFNLSWLALARSEAYRSVFKQWHLDWQEDNSPCDFALNSGLDCLEHKGNWRSLRQLNRPAILTLYDTDGAIKYLPVVGVSDQAVTVAMGDQELIFSRDQIDRHWLGEFKLIWQPPPYRSAVIRPGQIMDKTAWLVDTMRQLQSVLDVRFLENTEANLKENIKRFQAASGLVADGIPGQMTVIQFNTALNKAVPRLDRKLISEIKPKISDSQEAL
ncbi:MAG: hypothetical protein MI864_25765, partial [Pseudomonadales bacterium]|nr:hypothetical protein [Pseudomonadales bacterium]